MKNVAIVTIESVNFGNRLQNYALQHALEILGYNVETIRRAGELTKHKTLFKTVKLLGHKALQTKYQCFLNFNKNIKLSKYYADANTAPAELSTAYDYFVTGSDQVWNPHYDFVGMTDLLSFAQPEQKISYAASFGVDKLDEVKRDRYANALVNFKAISVREDAGAKLVRDLTGREAAVVLDPTLLLTKQEWDKVIKKPECAPKGGYALIYSLGERSENFNRAIASLDKNIEPFDILGNDKKSRQFAVGPSEFLYLIKNADCVLTDSFHATVFSALYHKRVQTFIRKGIDMSSRIVTLLKTIGLEDSVKFDGGGVSIVSENDYLNVDREIAAKKAESIEFLNSALVDNVGSSGGGVQ